jgi:signal peptidase I
MEAVMVRCFCRLYLVMLYAYPRDFRQQFGGEMLQLFRDRCRQVTRSAGKLRWIRFVSQSATDWFSTMMAEQTEAVRRVGLRDLARAVWTAGRKTQPRGFVAEWSMTLIVFLFATTTLVQAYVVPSGSMEGSLRVGDHMLVDRLAYSDPGEIGTHFLPYRDVQRGDIIAFHYPEDVRETYVKRVIGVPGDRIRIEDKQVVRNGQRLEEPYTQHIDAMTVPYRDNFPAAPQYGTTPRGYDMLRDHVRDGEVVVPPGMLFAMGDNRDNSSDSRYWGFVPRGYVVGKPLVVYWSYDAATEDLQSWTWNHVVDVMAHFFTKTRWERTLLVPHSQQARVAR